MATGAYNLYIFSPAPYDVQSVSLQHDLQFTCLTLTLTLCFYLFFFYSFIYSFSILLSFSIFYLFLISFSQGLVWDEKMELANGIKRNFKTSSNGLQLIDQDMPKSYTWCDMDGHNYCTRSRNQHIPQVSH
jgi:hypothetical protein